MLGPGETLSGYELVEKLGERHKGPVWHARDKRSGRDVALRVLKFGDDAARMRRFREESQTLAALAHPNIATPIAVEESQGTPFAVTELVRGAGLDERAGGKALASEEFFALALPLTAAIAAAHERRVVHGDLKPRNVRLGHDGTLKVLDFGLRDLRVEDLYPGADPADLPTQTLTQDRPIGPNTLPYCSPERVQSRSLDHRADIWSLGTMLYELATGQRPFTAESPADLIVAILRDAPRSVSELNPALPAQLDRALARALAKDRGNRLQAAKFLHEDLSGMSHGGGA